MMSNLNTTKMIRLRPFRLSSGTANRFLYVSRAPVHLTQATSRDAKADPLIRSKEPSSWTMRAFCNTVIP